MESHHVNIEDILKMPESEFQQTFSEWLENDGIARSLQAKLRKDLIDSFNKTSLGRKIFFQHQKSTRIMLSPLILVLNTLVAEFLYAQHCHYSLSVFSTEVPYRNTLPDFENANNFRFSQEELYEIFDAISSNIQPDLKSSVIAEYIEAPEKANRSLLYLILKNVVRKFVEPEKEAKIPEEVFEKNQQKHDSNSENESKKSKKDSNQMAYNTHFRYLNKYLVILSRKVKEMAYNLEELQRREGDVKNVRRKSLRNRKLERLNRSLEKISENLKHLSLSKRKNKNISTVLLAVDKMAKQFERCAFNFETISHKIGEEKKKKFIPNQEKSYSDWITELKNSKNGRKFISKVESSLRKALEREKQKMQEAFDVQLESHKELIRLKYKQKLLQQMGKEPPKEENEDSEKAKKLIEEKLNELERKHQEILQKLAESEKCVRDSPKSVSIQKELTTTKSIAVITDQPKFRSTSTETENQRIEEKQEHKTEENTQTTKPHLEEMAETIAQHERNIDHIVFDAKLRMQELEYESNQLERSFQEYLKRQKETKEHMEESVSTIWDKYNFEKKMLTRRSEALKATRRSFDQLRFQRDFGSAYSVSNVPTIEVNAGDEDIRGSAPNITNFENPFRKLKNDMLFSGSLFKSNQKTHMLKGDATQTRAVPKEDKPKSSELSNSIEEKKNISREDKSKSPERGNNAERKRNLLLLLSQKPTTTVKEISHEEAKGSESKLTLNVPPKNEETTKISSEQSGISSDINIKDITLDDINISGSKSSSNKTEEKTTRSGPSCRRRLFGKTEQFSMVDKKQEDNGVLKNFEKKLLEPNIFEPSSFSKNDKESSKDINLNPNKNEVVKTTEPPDLRLDLPGPSPINVSSSNSTSTSFKLNLSVGRGDVSGSDDFWS